MLTIGFVGLGALGGAIATRLQQAGHPLVVWGRQAARVQPWLAAGARRVDSAAEVAAECEITITCVTDTAAMEEVVFGPTGLVVGGRPSTILVDHSTIHPLATRSMALRLREGCGMQWVDAPVTGGVIAAEQGRLVVMAGGAAADIARITPILTHYSQRITHMGENGAGQAAKIANQMIIGGNVAVVAEALNYAANFGVSAPMLPDALAGGWADSAVLQHHARRMAAADYSSEVNARIMVKDIDIACDMGRETGSPMPVTALVQQLYRHLIANGDANKGQSGLMWLYKKTPL